MKHLVCHLLLEGRTFKMEAVIACAASGHNNEYSASLMDISDGNWVNGVVLKIFRIE